MGNVILIAALFSGLSAIAQSPAATGLSIKSLTVKESQATLAVRADGKDVALTGPMSSSPQLQSADGRLYADCASIGKTLECEIDRDGGNGALQVFNQKDASSYVPVGNLILSSGGDSFQRLTELQNSRGLDEAQTVAALNKAVAKASTVAQVMEALQNEAPARVQLSEGRLPPPPGGPLPAVGGAHPHPPVVVAPRPIDIAAGQASVRSHHHEEHYEKRDIIEDTYEREHSIPLVEESYSYRGCDNGYCQEYGPGPCCGPAYPPPQGACDYCQRPVRPIEPCCAPGIPQQPIVIAPPPGYYGRYVGPPEVEHYYRGPVRGAVVGRPFWHR